MRTRVAHGVAGCVLPAFVLAESHGQCSLQWHPRVAGAWPDNEILAVTTWDPDGPGPQGAVVIAGGNLLVEPNPQTRGVALWDGATWRTLTSTPVYAPAAAVCDPDKGGPLGQLPAVGGSFTAIDGVNANRVAWWDGATWHPFGAGIGPDRVKKLVVHEGDLIAGGVFFSAGGVSTTGLARWDGSAWHDLSVGLTSPDALLSQGGNLYAAGHIGGGLYGVKQLQKGAWSLVGSNSPNKAYALAMFQGQLIAAGSFFMNPTNHNIARFDGTMWQPMGEFDGTVVSLTIWDPDGPGPMPQRLIAGGGFGIAGGLPIACIASWNGTQWASLGSGMDAGPWAFAQWNGDLVVGGIFHTAGGQNSPFFARYGCPDCEPDCNGDGLLNLSDFGCFQTKFAVGNMQADCNRDGLLQLSDFGCFQTKFALGCP